MQEKILEDSDGLRKLSHVWKHCDPDSSFQKYYIYSLKINEIFSTTWEAFYLIKTSDLSWEQWASLYFNLS